jgi:hypothetical protein
MAKKTIEQYVVNHVSPVRTPNSVSVEKFDAATMSLNCYRTLCNSKAEAEQLRKNMIVNQLKCWLNEEGGETAYRAGGTIPTWPRDYGFEFYENDHQYLFIRRK